MHVEPWRGGYNMTYESHFGTTWAHSRDGIEWKNDGFLHKRSGKPMDAAVLLFAGASRKVTWDRNCIVRWMIERRVFDSAFLENPVRGQ